MALWTVKEVSAKLQCSQQNIYQKMDKLKANGFVELDETDNKEKINENGYNYLLNQRKQTMKNNSYQLNNKALNEVENTDNRSDSTIQQDFIIKFLQDEITDLKKRLAEEQADKKYWQDLYVQRNDDFMKHMFPPMLDTEEGNKKTEENIKKGFFARIFNR